jgi:Tfp pilus assembly protein PilN
MDLKKEIKLSDLFRRNGKDTVDAGDDSLPEEPKPKRRLFSRAPKDSNGASEPSGGNGRFGAEAKTAPPVPEIPLMRAFDLLPKDQRRQDSERRPGLIQIGVALFAVVVLAALGALFLMTSSSLNGKRRERDALQAQLAALQVQAEKPSPTSGPELEGERAARTNALATALSGRVAWDRLLRDISLVLPSDVYLTALTAQSPTPASAPTPAATTTTATHFAIAGSTGEQEDVALLLSRLSILPELSGVQLVSSLRGDEGDVVFTINAVVRHEAATP